MNIILVQSKKIGTHDSRKQGQRRDDYIREGILKPVTRFIIRDKYILNE